MSATTDGSAAPAPVRLRDAVRAHDGKLLTPERRSLYGGIGREAPVLVVLAAGKGTRYGPDPKCIQLVLGKPLARHSIDAFRQVSPSPAICLVSYCKEQVAAALGDDNLYVASDNPAGGTGFAVYEAFSVRDLLEHNPLLVITMGDRVVPPSIFRRLWQKHRDGGQEADLTFLTARYEEARSKGKGRILRDRSGRVLRIVEERDYLAEHPDEDRPTAIEGNCPLYLVRAATLWRHLQEVNNANAQRQFYVTDIVETISAAGGDIRTFTVSVEDPEYDLLCADVTRPGDLALVEGILTEAGGFQSPEDIEVAQAAESIVSGRRPGQVASIARQLREVIAAAQSERLSFRPDQPAAIGISGGRVRIAFMHPDMARFFGPAWQMPIGAADAKGTEQITVVVQAAEDGRVDLFPTSIRFRERINSILLDRAAYPEQISDLYEYERFGTKRSETVLLSLGYFSDSEIEERKRNGVPLPPPSLWVSNSMRRPFALVENAIASMRTLSSGHLGAQIQKHLGRDAFTGLRLVSTGSIPEGGFSSSSAVTVATQNAINALWEIGIPADVLVQLACQAEYGTGVRAGSLDQATEQKGRLNAGTLMSSNPRDNYRIIGTYPIPADRVQILFPYSVERDRAAWRWSHGTYGEVAGQGRLTTGETRKLTGKAAEAAAILTRLPLDRDFFQLIEDDLTDDGVLNIESRKWICSVLRQTPLLIPREELREQLQRNAGWYAEQLCAVYGLGAEEAARKAESTIASLFEGWHEPVLRRTRRGVITEEHGVPLRAMVAYLFAEVAKNFYLIHHPDEWITYVTLSQRGDRCYEIDPGCLPGRDEMERQLPWESGVTGPDLLALWLERCGAVPFDFNQGLDDVFLDPGDPPEFHRLLGSNFFRGLALIDLAEAMLKRAFGDDAVAVRVNAAGQGDFFQVHVDKTKTDPNRVKAFLRAAFYRRFGLNPEPEFVEVCPGGGAVGVRLSRFDLLEPLIVRLQAYSPAR